MDKGPAQSATLTAEDALKMYEKLAALRRIETASGNLYKEKIIRGFCHLYSGIVFIILLKKNIWKICLPASVKVLRCICIIFESDLDTKTLYHIYHNT